jgi:hypothetical protein
VAGDAAQEVVEVIGHPARDTADELEARDLLAPLLLGPAVGYVADEQDVHVLRRLGAEPQGAQRGSLAGSLDLLDAGGAEERCAVGLAQAGKDIQQSLRGLDRPADQGAEGGIASDHLAIPVRRQDAVVDGGQFIHEPADPPPAFP